MKDMTPTTNYSAPAPDGKTIPAKTRIACYERVSTEEQVHGYSIAAQKSALDAYCAERGYIIIGHYTDEGVSGGKPPSKRPAMARLLHDVERGLVDLVLFCKLDRWFRNVKEYFKAQDILEAHGVSWNAIQEDYETETASGRMTVTIMLSVAQQERERTSERIRAVFDYRAAKGEFLSGGRAVPYGYLLEDKHLIKDPAKEPILNRLFSLVLAGEPLGAAVQTVRAEFPDCGCGYINFRRIAFKEIYAGIHNGRRDFCPAYITPAEHERIMTRKGTRRPADPNRCYLFSGILVCPECGRKMGVTSSVQSKREYVYYFCRRNKYDRVCGFSKKLAESRLECALTAALFVPGQFIVEDVTPVKTPPKPALNAKEIENKMRRLAETYTDGLIDREAYKKRLADLNQQLQTARNTPRTRFKPPVLEGGEILQGDLQTVYTRFTAREKRRFWQMVLLSVKVDADYKPFDFIFADVST